MGVISWLVARLGLVRASVLREVQFEQTELQKLTTHLKQELSDKQNLYDVAEEQLAMLHRNLADMEETAAHENELSKEAQSRVGDLQSEIDYLKEQVKIYQTRLGLLPAPPQEARKIEQKPLRTAREPFAVVQARIQTERSEAYWKARAAAVEAGVTGTTSDVETKS